MDSFRKPHATLTFSEGTEIVYRGIAIATSQDTQEYQLTNDKYYF